ncbi:MAG TPA: LysM peptidoglycan-binding domain-containing protein [bacterium]|nr:LysM peptidoglycan-binding domain-containing protein [bacterium]
MADTQNKKENSKDGLALIVGGVFILALVFATYNYFNKGSKKNELDKIQQEKVFEEDTVEDTEDKKDKGDLNGEGVATKKDNSLSSDKSDKKDSYDSASWQVTRQADNTWIANDYEKGDIKGASYTVRAGDTLWEIAEGLYGDGTAWTKILSANSGQIEYLPNGSQALIRPGQILVLP